MQLAGFSHFLAENGFAEQALSLITERRLTSKPSTTGKDVKWVLYGNITSIHEVFTINHLIQICDGYGGDWGLGIGDWALVNINININILLPLLPLLPHLPLLGYSSLLKIHPVS